MINTAKRKIMSIAEVLHLRIFGHEMGEEMKKFVKNLGWMSIGAISSGIFIFITNLTAGRLLGPEEYGKYSLIISMGQLFIIPMLFGIGTASIQYLANNRDEKDKIISTANISVFILIILATITLFLFREYLKNIFKVNNIIFLFAMAYSASLALKYLSEAILKGMHKFKFLSGLGVINAFFIFLAFFGIIIFTTNRTFVGYGMATISGMLLCFFIVFFKNRVELSNFDFNVFKKIMNYGAFASLGAVSGFTLNNIDRIALNNYLGFSSVGLFAAYLSASSFFSGQILQIFVDVFFPSVSSAENKKIVYEKIKKIIYISFLPLFLLNMLATGIIIKLYGEKYELNYAYIVLFSLLGVLTLCQSVLWWFIASFGNKGIRFTSTSGITIGIFNILLMIFMVKLLGFIGAVYCLIITATVILVVSIIYLKRKIWSV